MCWRGWGNTGFDATSCNLPTNVNECSLNSQRHLVSLQINRDECSANRLPRSIHASAAIDSSPASSYLLTFPVITKHPSWSMMSTSRGEGGWQNFCCRIWRIGSITFGVSLRATAMCPNARIVWSGIRWASLKQTSKKCVCITVRNARLLPLLVIERGKLREKKINA